MEDAHNVNGNPLPKLLTDLLRCGQWRHPGDDVLKELIPFPMDAVDFLKNIRWIERESSSLLCQAEDARLRGVFYLSRGSQACSPVDLPWLDAEKAVLIAVSRMAGDDVAIALDYRENIVDPRVVASHWVDGGKEAPWGEVSRSFSTFVAKLHLRGI